MKTIMIIVLILVCGTLGADSWLEVEWTFQFGWIPQGSMILYNSGKEGRKEMAEPFDATFIINAYLFKYFIIGGKVINLFNHHITDSIIPSFSPSGINYVFNIGFNPVENISIIYEHSCFHPIVPYFGEHGLSSMTDGSYNRLYIEIKNKIEF